MSFIDLLNKIVSIITGWISDAIIEEDTRPELNRLNNFRRTVQIQDMHRQFQEYERISQQLFKQSYFEQFKDIDSESPISETIEIANNATNGSDKTKGSTRLVTYILERIQKLENHVEKLNNHIRYMPDGEGYEDAKNHFENLVVEKEN
jgi:hypothetical protein